MLENISKLADDMDPTRTVGAATHGPTVAQLRDSAAASAA